MTTGKTDILFQKAVKKSHTFFAVKNIFGRFCLLLYFSFCNGGTVTITTG